MLIFENCVSQKTKVGHLLLGTAPITPDVISGIVEFYVEKELLCLLLHRMASLVM